MEGLWRDCNSLLSDLSDCTSYTFKKERGVRGEVIQLGKRHPNGKCARSIPAPFLLLLGLRCIFP